MSEIKLLMHKKVGNDWVPVTDDDFESTATLFGSDLIHSDNAAEAKILLELTKSDVGLNNVDNTSDINKPISNATQTAFNLKVDNSRVSNGDALISQIVVGGDSRLNNFTKPTCQVSGTDIVFTYAIASSYGNSLNFSIQGTNPPGGGVFFFVEGGGITLDVDPTMAPISVAQLQNALQNANLSDFYSVSGNDSLNINSDRVYPFEDGGLLPLNSVQDISTKQDSSPLLDEVSNLTDDGALFLNSGNISSRPIISSDVSDASSGSIYSNDANKVIKYDNLGNITSNNQVILTDVISGDKSLSITSTALTFSSSGYNLNLSVPVLGSEVNLFLNWPDGSGSTDGYLAITSNPDGSITKSIIGLGNVENQALSTWLGSPNIVNLGTITGGTWNATTIALNKGGTGAITASGARTNLGATTVGSNLFTATNPSAITFPQINADNTITFNSASAERTALGLGNLSTITAGSGVAVLLAGTSSGTGGPAGTISPTFTGAPALAAATADSLYSAGQVRANTTNTSATVMIGGLPSGINTYGGLWIGAGALNPLDTNYTILSGAGATLFNGSGGIEFRISNSTKIRVLSSGGFNIGSATDPGGGGLYVTGTSILSSGGTFSGTFTGGHTYSGQIELTGQAATNGTSAMTRDLVGQLGGISLPVIGWVLANPSNFTYNGSNQTTNIRWFRVSGYPASAVVSPTANRTLGTYGEIFAAGTSGTYDFANAETVSPQTCVVLFRFTVDTVNAFLRYRGFNLYRASGNAYILFAQAGGSYFTSSTIPAATTDVGVAVFTGDGTSSYFYLQIGTNVVSSSIAFTSAPGNSAPGAINYNAGQGGAANGGEFIGAWCFAGKATPAQCKAYAEFYKNAFT